MVAVTGDDDAQVIPPWGDPGLEPGRQAGRGCGSGPSGRGPAPPVIRAAGRAEVGRYGLTQTLAATPQLVARWEDTRTVHQTATKQAQAVTN